MTHQGLGENSFMPGQGLPGTKDFDRRFFRREGSYKKMNRDGESPRAGKIGRWVLAVALVLICSKPLVAQDVDRHSLTETKPLGEISAALNSAGAADASTPTDAAEVLPDAPDPQAAPASGISSGKNLLAMRTYVLLESRL
jgi:hypothetical protein